MFTFSHETGSYYNEGSGSSLYHIKWIRIKLFFQKFLEAFLRPTDLFTRGFTGRYLLEQILFTSIFYTNYFNIKVFTIHIPNIFW